MAKDISKITRVPLPKVAAVMQKYPLDRAGMMKAYTECQKLAVDVLNKDLKAIFPF